MYALWFCWCSKIRQHLAKYYLWNYRFRLASLVAQTVKLCLHWGRPGFDPWVRKIPWRRKRQPTPYSYLENSMDRGAWWATVHEVKKSRTRLSNFTFFVHTEDRIWQQNFLIYMKTSPSILWSYIWKSKWTCMHIILGETILHFWKL